MKRLKWNRTADVAAVFLIAVSLYAAGFGLLRFRYVELTKYPGGGVGYYSTVLSGNPDGALGRAIRFYRPAFYLEAKCHRTDTVVINGWMAGMKVWDKPF